MFHLIMYHLWIINVIVSLYNFPQSEGINETAENVLLRKMKFDDLKQTKKNIILCWKEFNS